MLIDTEESAPPRKLIFLNETDASTKMTERGAWTIRGERLIANVPHDHWKTTTFLAGLHHDGIPAPQVLDSPMNDPTFKVYIHGHRL